MEKNIAKQIRYVMFLYELPQWFSLAFGANSFQPNSYFL